MQPLVTERRRDICASKHGLFAAVQLAFGLVLGLFSSHLSCLALFQPPGWSKVMGLALSQATHLFEPELQA